MSTANVYLSNKRASLNSRLDLFPQVSTSLDIKSKPAEVHKQVPT